MAGINERRLKDATLIVSAALPNAANVVNTNSIDLGETTPFPVGDQFEVQIVTTAGNGANTKNINITLQDSADNSTFANIATLGAPAVRITEANGSYAATTANLKLPAVTRRYIRARVSGEADGGNAANGTVTVQLVF